MSGKRRNGPIRAWRAWRVVTGELEELAPRGTLYGVMNGHTVPWVGGLCRATCIPVRLPGYERGWDEKPHKAPGARCECGIRGDLDLANLLAYGALSTAATIRREHGVTLGWLGKNTWRNSVEVVGEVELMGRRLPPRFDDTRTTLRAERARVGRRVFFARPLWDLAEPFEEVHPWSTAVRVEALHDVLAGGWAAWTG